MTAVAFDQSGKLADLLPRLNLEGGAAELLQPGMSVQQALAALLARQRHRDALRLLALALPRREAVWWAAQCCRAVETPADPAAYQAALEHAEKWAAAPTEENRRAAGAAAQAADPGTAAGQAAQAAYWSGGSLSLPNSPVVPPPEHLLPTAVGVAAILAGLRPGPKLMNQTYERFVALAQEVALGKNRWKEERPSPAVKPAPPGARPTPRRT